MHTWSEVVGGHNYKNMTKKSCTRWTWNSSLRLECTISYLRQAFELFTWSMTFDHGLDGNCTRAWPRVPRWTVWMIGGHVVNVRPPDQSNELITQTNHTGTGSVIKNTVKNSILTIMLTLSIFFGQRVSQCLILFWCVGLAFWCVGLAFGFLSSHETERSSVGSRVREPALCMSLLYGAPRSVTGVVVRWNWFVELPFMNTYEFNVAYSLTM